MGLFFGWINERKLNIRRRNERETIFFFSQNAIYKITDKQELI